MGHFAEDQNLILPSSYSSKLNMHLSAKSQIVYPYLSEECTIELNNVWAITTPHYYIQIHEKLFLFFFIHSWPYSLEKNDNRCHTNRILSETWVNFTTALKITKLHNINQTGKLPYFFYFIIVSLIREHLTKSTQEFF